MDITTTILIVALCVVLEAFFSGSEIAIVSISRHKLSHLVEKGQRGALLLEAQFKNPSRLYGATSMGTNVFVFLGTSVMTAYLVQVNPEKADLWATLIMAPVTLLFGEIFPKALFQRFTDTISYIVIYPVVVVQKIFSPFLWVLSTIAMLILGRGEKEHAHGIHRYSEEEIRGLFSMGKKDFDLHPDEVKMIDRVFDFGKTTVEQCMIPLINMAAVGINEPINSVKAKLIETKHSRLPVYEDRIYNITGVVSAFSVLRFSKDATKARDMAQPAYYVYKKKKIGDLLPEMQQAGIQLAVVVNEYSASIGIVTREDLIEEIFGEIEDEYDEEESPVKESGANRWAVDASAEMDFLNESYGWNLPLGDYETIGGYMLTHLERIPVKGEKIFIGEFGFIILEASDMGLKSIEVFKIGESKNSE